jgi:hypothetical protein
MSIVVGCDYSASEAFLAVVKDERVAHTVKLKLAGDLEEQRLRYFLNLQYTFASLRDEKICETTLYIEEPWIAGGHFPQAGLKLARNAAYIELAAITMGYRVIHVHVMTWRKGVYGHGKPQNPKGTATEWCLYNLGYETKNHNLAEAACISYYGSRC